MRARCAGFTLLEMMLAIGILAIVLTMIAGSFNAVAHSKIHGEQRLNIDREGRAILWQLSSEVRGAIQTPLAVSNVMLIGTGQMRDGQPLDSLTISTMDAGHRRAITGFGAEQIVIYSTTPTQFHRRWFTLTRAQMSGLLRSGPTTPIVLGDNLIALHIRYFDGGNWLESWESSALARNQQLPMAVAIDLALGTENGRVMNFSTQVQVPMAVTQW